MFVGNVPVTSTKKTIIKLFAEFGKVEAVRFRSAARPDLKTTKKVKCGYHTFVNGCNIPVFFFFFFLSKEIY